MKIAIMQPYFLPYIGYWQLLNAVDKFVIYDNIQYTKKGWINRNRFLQNGKEALFSIPINKGETCLNVDERTISSSFKKEKLINQFDNAYRCSPFFYDVFPIIKHVISYDDNNLFQYILHSIKVICSYLKIDSSKIVISSKITIDHSLKSENRVIALCHELGANKYYNPIGGTSLYDKENFANKNIILSFLQAQPFEYKQLTHKFTPWLSIVDIMMFNSLDAVQEMLNKYSLE